ncbi:MAG: MarR family transcriptional regulator [Fibrobacteres bacterium]|nr:MarR family transcriptional regulator [Fibrobacterota bacterium]
MRKRLNKSEFELLASFRYALRRFLHFSEESVRALGTEPQQHQALLAVEGFPGREYVSLGELAEKLQIKHHSAVGLVNRMVKQELLMRKPSREDRRRVHVMLTPRGKDLLERLSAVHREELRRLGPQLKDLLERLSENDPT